MNLPIFFIGKSYELRFHQRGDGSTPAREFFDSYPDGNRESRHCTRLISLMHRFATMPPGTPFPGTQFKRFENDIWEFKSHQLRLFVYRETGRLVILLMGLQKKQDDLRPGEVQQIRNMADEYRTLHRRQANSSVNKKNG